MYSPPVSRFRRLVDSPWSDTALAVGAAAAQTAPLLFQQSSSGAPWHWWGYVAAVGASPPWRCGGARRFDALRAGASGFLLKDVRRDDLVHAVRVVAAAVPPTRTERLNVLTARDRIQAVITAYETGLLVPGHFTDCPVFHRRRRCLTRTATA